MESALDRQAVARRGKQLEYFTIAWNSLEGLVAVVAGALAGSISLVGFGVDSFIEVTSGAVLLWRMSVDADVRKRERREKLSLRILPFHFSLPFCPCSICRSKWKASPLKHRGWLRPRHRADGWSWSSSTTGARERILWKLRKFRRAGRSS